MSRSSDRKQANENPPAERVEDMTGQPPTNEATNRDMAARLANMLEDLQFPATKQEIKDHVNRKSPAGSRSSDAMESVVSSLKDGARYENVYEIEKAAGLVKEE